MFYFFWLRQSPKESNISCPLDLGKQDHVLWMCRKQCFILTLTLAYNRHNREEAKHNDILTYGCSLHTHHTVNTAHWAQLAFSFQRWFVNLGMYYIYLGWIISKDIGIYGGIFSKVNLIAVILPCMVCWFVYSLSCCNFLYMRHCILLKKYIF